MLNIAIRGTPPGLSLTARILPGSLSASRRLNTMTHAARTLYVKGDPVKGLLGDCPFCHRALLTLEIKVCLNHDLL
jgi:hypothetical protein